MTQLLSEYCEKYGIPLADMEESISLRNQAFAAFTDRQLIEKVAESQQHVEQTVMEFIAMAKSHPMFAALLR